MTFLEENDVLIIDEGFKLSNDILKKDEIDVISYDKDFIYFLTDYQITEILSDVFGFEIYEPKTAYVENSIKEKKYEETFLKRLLVNKECAVIVEFGMPVFLKIPEEILISAYPVKRRVSMVYRGINGEESLDILPFVETYPNYLTKSKLLERIEKSFQNEWKKLHSNKEIKYVQ